MTNAAAWGALVLVAVALGGILVPGTVADARSSLATLSFTAPTLGGRYVANLTGGPVQSAALTIQGEILPGTDRILTLEAANTPGTAAWSGWEPFVNVGSASGAYESTPLSTAELDAISHVDGKMHVVRHTLAENPTGLMVVSYLHVRFTVQTAGTPAFATVPFTVTWIGAGTGNASPAGGVSDVGGGMLGVFDLTRQGWQVLANYSTPTPDANGDGSVDLVTLQAKSSLVNASNALVFDVVVLAAPAFNSTGDLTVASTLWTDDLRITATLPGAGSLPSDIALDVGDDGISDWRHAGVLDRLATVDVTASLARLLQGAASIVTVPFVFTSASEGLLAVVSLDLVYDDTPPAFLAWPAAIILNEDQQPAKVVDLATVVTDNGPLDALTFRIANILEQAALSATIPTGTTWIVLTPATDWSGTTSLTVEVTDPSGLSATSAPLQVIVQEVNDRPSIGPIPDLNVQAGTKTSVQITPHDIDGDVVVCSEDSSFVTYDPGTGEATVAPSTDSVGPHTVLLHCEDGRGGIAELGFIVVVAPPPAGNRAPHVDILLPYGRTSFPSNEPIMVRAAVTDPDGDALTVTWTWDNAPLDTGETIVVPAGRATAGTHLLKATVTDGKLTSLATAMVTFTVPGGPKPVPASQPVTVAASFPLAAGIAGLAAVLGTVGVEFSRYRVLLTILPLYTRIRPEEVLDQYTRGRIHGFIVANPGSNYNHIRQQLRLKNGTAAYHLQTLEREEYVVSMRDGIYRRFYPQGASVPPAGAFTSKQEKIVEHLLAHPGATVREVARTLGASDQVASYHLRWMARAGQVEVRPDGRMHRYWAKLSEQPEPTSKLPLR